MWRTETGRRAAEWRGNDGVTGLQLRIWRGRVLRTDERMHLRSCFSRLIVCAALAAAVGLSPGCGNVFVAKHRVLVDAIAAPGVTNAGGQSYRLVARKAIVAATPMHREVVTACVMGALTNVGMFEAPPNMAPDLFIDVSYGSDAGPRVDPSARETFLQLSARANREKWLEHTGGLPGPELWDVRAGVMGIAGRAESAMPLLASVAVAHIGTDTKAELKVEIPQNAPAVASVRENAIKIIEGKSSPSMRPPAAGAPAGETQAPATPGAPAGTTPPSS